MAAAGEGPATHFGPHTRGNLSPKMRAKKHGPDCNSWVSQSIWAKKCEFQSMKDLIATAGFHRKHSSQIM